MRIVYEVTDKNRDGKRIERAEKLERRKARRAKNHRQSLSFARMIENI